MTRTLTGTTIVHHPSSRQPVVLTKGTTLPDWADGLVGDHLLTPAQAAPQQPSGGDALNAASAPAETRADAAPPRAGKGSGRDEWAAYAAALGVAVDDSDGRDAIIATLTERGLLDEE